MLSAFTVYASMFISILSISVILFIFTRSENGYNYLEVFSRNLVQRSKIPEDLSHTKKETKLDGDNTVNALQSLTFTAAYSRLSNVQMQKTFY